MAHLTSAPALHCARTILKSYVATVRPPDSLKSGKLDGLTNSEKHVATLIDHTTNVFQVVALRPELRYWQRRLSAGTATAPHITAFLHKVLATLESVPHLDDSDEKIVSTFAAPLGFDTRPEVRILSKWAVEASRVLFYYYDMQPLGRHAHDMLDRHHVAGIVEVCLGMSRVMKLEPVLKENKAALVGGRLSEESVRKVLRTTGVLFDKMPTYEQREEEAKLL